MSRARNIRTPAALANLGALLKEERVGLGLTQVQAADQFAVSLKSLRNIEQGLGGVPLATASKILKYFGKELRIGDIVMSPERTSRNRPRRETVLETLKLVKPVLERKFHIKKIALFGSVARDEATPDSDIDLVASFAGIQSFETQGKLIAFLETLFDGIKVDLVDSAEMLPTIQKSSKRDLTYVD